MGHFVSIIIIWCQEERNTIIKWWWTTTTTTNTTTNYGKKYSTHTHTWISSLSKKSTNDDLSIHSFERTIHLFIHYKLRIILQQKKKLWWLVNWIWNFFFIFFSQKSNRSNHNYMMMIMDELNIMNNNINKYTWKLVKYDPLSNGYVTGI